MIREITDWAIARNRDGEPLLTFASRDLAVDHWRKVGSPSSLMVIKRTITIQVVKEYIKPRLSVVQKGKEAA